VYLARHSSARILVNLKTTLRCKEYAVATVSSNISSSFAENINIIRMALIRRIWARRRRYLHRDVVIKIRSVFIIS
jgi:hypothetical protein